MFEFHGWATIEVDDRDDADTKVLDARKKDATDRVRATIDKLQDGMGWFELRELGNDLAVVTAHGLRNHRQSSIIDFFEWLAVEVPDSYGLLYVHDDESADHENEFRVWRLARGQLKEFSDPFLSPCIPTLEPPWEWPPSEPPKS